MRNPAPFKAEQFPECAPPAVGMSSNDVERVWRAVERWHGTGLHPAITLVMRRHGRVVIRRSIGAATARYGVDTPICLFSASKAITALLVHKLVELGKLRLEDRVADYIPEFGCHGKQRVDIRQLLAHRAGIPALPPEGKRDPALLYDWDGAVRMLCAARPLPESFEKQAYHAITAGYIIGELVQRVSGMSLREALDSFIAAPLGCKLLTYGLDPSLRPQPAPSVVPSAGPFWPLSALVRQILGVSFEEATEISNEEGFLSSVIPSGNIFATADDACRVYQLMLNGGELDGVRVFRPETIAEAVRPLGQRRIDGMLKVPLRFSAGFMIGDSPFGIFGPRCPQAYGHLGFINIFCWADPQRGTAVALLTSGKTMALRNTYHLVRVLSAIGRA